MLQTGEKFLKIENEQFFITFFFPVIRISSIKSFGDCFLLKYKNKLITLSQCQVQDKLNNSKG